MSEKKYGTLFVCEKPMQAKHIMKTLGKENDRAIIAPVVTSYKFNYPKYVPFKDLSYLGKPSYKMTLDMRDLIFTVYKKEGTEKNGILENRFKEIAIESNLHGHCEYNTKLDTSCSDDPRDFLKMFDEIVYACDSDYSGARAFDFHLNNFFGVNDYYFHNSDIKYTSMHYLALDQKSLKISYLDRKDILSETCFGSQKRKIYIKHLLNEWRESYKKKDYFEYNYNVNSIVLFNEILRIEGLITPSNTVTKNTIATLFFLSKQEEPITEGVLIKKMERLNIGSCCSRAAILEALFEDSFICYIEQSINGTKKRRIILSDLGKIFISSVHNKLKYENLTVNLNNDIDNKDFSFSDFKNKYDKIIKTMFEKQKGLNRRLVE